MVKKKKPFLEGFSFEEESAKAGISASPIALAGLQKENKDKAWLASDPRSFGEILDDWQLSVAPTDRNKFIRELGLEGALSPEDLALLILGTKAPSRELARFLSASISTSLCSRQIFRNRGYAAASTDKEHVDITPKAMQEARAYMLRYFAASGGSGANPFLDWLDEKISATAARAGYATDLRKSISNLAAFLGISTDTFIGKSKMQSAAAMEKAEELANLFDLHDEEREKAITLFTSAWSGTAAGGSDMALPRMLRFLRHTQDLTIKDFARHLKLREELLSELENGLIFPKRQLLQKLVTVCNLDNDEQALLQDACEQYDAALAQRLRPHFQPIADRFGKYGITVEGLTDAARDWPPLCYYDPRDMIRKVNTVVRCFRTDGLTRAAYLTAVMRRPQLFYQTPKILITNIMDVAIHFRKDGLKLADYLQAAVKAPPLFSLKPNTVIGHINLLIDLYRKELIAFSGSKYSRVSHGKNADLKPLFDVLLKNPVLLCLADDNYTLKAIYATVTKVPSRALRGHRGTLEDELRAALGHPDPHIPVPKIPEPKGLYDEDGNPTGYDASGKWITHEERRQLMKSHAKNLLLRALIREEIIKGQLAENAGPGR